jgi:tellurite resistance protein
MVDREAGLTARVIAGLTAGPASEPNSEGRSLMHQAAAAFARRPAKVGSTIPTGFDPQAASLFEAVVEASYLVANADGEFDATERDTFEQVVVAACKNAVQLGQLKGLVSDLSDQLAEDGIDQRIGMLARAVQCDDHKLEVLRVAALMAHISGGVVASEREVLMKLARDFALAGEDVQRVLDEVTSAIRTQS